MFPILFHIGPITLHTYGLMVASGFLAGYMLSRRRFEINGLPLAVFDQLIFIVMGSGILGARLLYVLLNGPASLVEDPLSFFRIWEGGLVFFGGFLAAGLSLAIYAGVKELSLLKLGDSFATPLLLAQAIGRLGCFAAGCCYGRPTSSPLGVIFTDLNSLAPLNIKLHPTQLYSSAGNFLLFLLLLQIEKKTSRTGIVLSSYLIGYGIFRFLIEFVRNDDRGPVVAGLWPSQCIALAALLAGIVVLVYAKKTQRT